MLALLAQYYTIALVLCASTILALVAGFVGVIAVTTKKSLLTDALAHATLPGMVLIIVFCQTTNPWYLLWGGYCTAVLAIGADLVLTKTTTLSNDTILGMILSVFFGVGLVALTYAQRKALLHSAFIQKLIFGNIALVSYEDCVALVLMAFFIAALLILSWKNILITIFDPIQARLLGYRTTMIYACALAMVMVVVGLGLHIMGALLMSTLLVAPVVTVRPWVSAATKLGTYAALCAVLGTLIGSMVSISVEHIPTGPSIVVVLTSMALVSIVYNMYCQSQYV